MAGRIAINNIIFLAVFEVLGAAILKFSASLCPSCNFPEAWWSRPWDGPY